MEYFELSYDHNLVFVCTGIAIFLFAVAFTVLGLHPQFTLPLILGAFVLAVIVPYVFVGPNLEDERFVYKKISTSLPDVGYMSGADDFVFFKHGEFRYKGEDGKNYRLSRSQLPDGLAKLSSFESGTCNKVFEILKFKRAEHGFDYGYLANPEADPALAEKCSDVIAGRILAEILNWK